MLSDEPLDGFSLLVPYALLPRAVVLLNGRRSKGMGSLPLPLPYTLRGDTHATQWRTLKGGVRPMVELGEKSLYERLGGYDAICAATNDLLGRLDHLGQDALGEGCWGRDASAPQNHVLGSGLADRPISRESRCVPPLPRIMPSPISGTPMGASAQSG
jgi:hypothetical protein